MVLYRFFYLKKMSDLLLPSFLVSDVSEWLRSLTKNERMSESLVFLSKSFICSFFRKKRAIRSENRWANSQPCFFATDSWKTGLSCVKFTQIRLSEILKVERRLYTMWSLKVQRTIFLLLSQPCTLHRYSTIKTFLIQRTVSQAVLWI